MQQTLLLKFEYSNFCRNLCCIYIYNTCGVTFQKRFSRVDLDWYLKHVYNIYHVIYNISFLNIFILYYKSVIFLLCHGLEPGHGYFLASQIFLKIFTFTSEAAMWRGLGKNICAQLCIYKYLNQCWQHRKAFLCGLISVLGLSFWYFVKWPYKA